MNYFPHILLVSVFTFAFLGALIGRRHLREDAIQAGAAEWQINPTTGERRFVWKGKQ